jgi:PAS domain S-box-containing protein
MYDAPRVTALPGAPAAADDAHVVARQAEGLRRLVLASGRLLVAHDSAEGARVLFEELGPHLAADVFLHFVTHPSGEDALALRANVGLDAASCAHYAHLPFGSEVCGMTALSRRVTYLSQVQATTDVATANLRALGIRAYVCSPLLVGERLLGTLSFGSRTRDAFDPDALDLIRSASYHLATAMERWSTEVELRAAMRALAERNALLHAVTDSASDLIWVKDRAGRLTFVNPAAEVLLTRDRPILGLDAWALTDDAAQAARIAANDERIMTTGAVERVEEVFGPPEAQRVFESVKTPLRDIGGAVTGLVGISRDVTELRTAARRKDEFLATLSHELRNPLAPIRYGLQVLRHAPPAAAAPTRAMIERQLDHLVRLVDDLLDVARVSQGKITLRRERIAVHDLVQSVLEAARPLVDTERHRLEVALDVPELVVDGDRTRLVQVFTNLLTNAAKYSEAGTRIRIAATRDGEMVALSVADEGVGIAPALLPTIWDIFTQVRDTLDKAQGGLGIGLSLVRKLVDMHGGTVHATSDGPGCGSTFTVRLPVVDAPASPAAPPADAPAAHDAGALRVLVVDDNVDGTDSLALLLELAGHEALRAYDGPAAIALARARAPDVVFLDIGLPGMDGHAVTRRLRADPATKDSFIVALTGWGSDDDRRRSREAGADLHLTKPVDPGRVDAVLRDAARQRARAERSMA